MSVRRTLITGGAGFIGSHLADHLGARGDDVIVVDDLSTGRSENLASCPGAEFIEARVSEAAGELERRGPFDEVYHLAAAVGVKRVLADPFDAIERNVPETITLLRLASRWGAPTLIASSSEVYGKSQRTPFREEDDCLYGPPTVRRWSYACSKAIDEHLALAAHARDGLPVVVARFFNIVGTRQVGDYGMVLPTFVGQVLAGEAPTVYGDGTQSRCFCDVRDAVPALPALLADEGCRGRVFNLGSDRRITIMDLARLVVEELGGAKQPRLVSYDRAYEPGFEDLVQRVPDTTRIREAIGFRTRTDLRESIRAIAGAMGAATDGSGRVARVGTGGVSSG